jgi:hypothetical protein
MGLKVSGKLVQHVCLPVIQQIADEHYDVIIYSAMACHLEDMIRG